MHHLVLFIIFLHVTLAVSPRNFCPNILEYEKQDGEWKGIITIPGPGQGRTVMEVEVFIDGRVFDRNSGGVSLLRPLKQTVSDAQKGHPIQYQVFFPKSVNPPQITKITLNYKEICNAGNSVGAGQWTFSHEFTYPSSFTQLSYIPDITTEKFNVKNTEKPVTVFTEKPIVTDPPKTSSTLKPQTHSQSWLERLPFSCGKRGVGDVLPTQLIIGGESVQPGEYPWLVALFHFKDETEFRLFEKRKRRDTKENSTIAQMKEYIRKRKFNLPGVYNEEPVRLQRASSNASETLTDFEIPEDDLKSSEIKHRFSRQVFQSSEVEFRCGATLLSSSLAVTAAHCVFGRNIILLQFGRFDLSNTSENYQHRNSLQIIVHPDYVPGNAFADVALIKFVSISFNANVTPVCLWGFGTRLDTIIKKGTVAGWGRLYNDGPFSVTPMQLSVQTVSLETCRNSHKTLRDIVKEGTFCAGGQSAGPCHGDSGSGFLLRHNKVWFLRGVVSTSLGNNYVCNLEEYAVYVDISFYLDWIKKYLF